MADIKKVIEALECCTAYYIDGDLTGHERCPYSGLNGGDGCSKLYADALELLRKHQDIELYIKDCEREIDTGKNDIEKTYYKGVHYGLLIAKELINGIRSHG